MRILAVFLALLSPVIIVGNATASFWGSNGHEMAARAAMAALPDGMPGFFADATDQMAYLNPEPDRWRVRDFQEMDQAFSYDHYIDLELVPEAARRAPHRYAYLAILYRDTDLEQPERDAGLLPFHILELYQRLVTEWRLWRQANPQERVFIEERILNDAGTLGHYVTDASQPHHTTIHFNGWNASSAMTEANPEGFTESRDFHGRFESGFVRAHVRLHHVQEALVQEPVRLEDMEAVRAAVWAHIQRSHEQVPTLYRLENEYGFDPLATPTARTVDFAAERLADGARFLRDLWWNAYLEGMEPAPARPWEATGGEPAEEDAASLLETEI